MFINRTSELSFLTAILERQHPGPGQFVMIMGGGASAKRRCCAIGLNRAVFLSPTGSRRKIRLRSSAANSLVRSSLALAPNCPCPPLTVGLSCGVVSPN